MNIFFLNSKAGFTLVETFVAITILLFVVIGPLSLFSKTLIDVIFAQNQITTLYLAQEGLELALNYQINISADVGVDCVDAIDIDSCLAEQNDSWLGDLAGCLDSSCTIDFIEPNIIEVVSINPDFGLAVDEDERLVHDSINNIKSIFSRKITLENISEDSVKIVSEASWEDPRTELKRSTILETIVYKNI